MLVLRDHGRETAARLGAAFAIGTAAYAITSAAGFDRVAGTWSLPLLAIVPTGGGVTSLRELVDLARKKPGGASYSSTGVHTVPHFLGALLSVESGAPMYHVPYSGASTAIVDRKSVV